MLEITVETNVQVYMFFFITELPWENYPPPPTTPAFFQLQIVKIPKYGHLLGLKLSAYWLDKLKSTQCIIELLFTVFFFRVFSCNILVNA